MDTLAPPEVHRVPGDVRRYYDEEILERFRRGMALLAVIYLAILVVEWVSLAAMFPGGGSLLRPSLWTLKTIAVLFWQYSIIRVNRAVVTGGENTRHLWGWANRVTLARGVLLALFAGFLFEPEPSGPAAWLPASIYAIAAIADFLDGFIAKKTNTRTELGAFLDGEFDGEGIFLVMAIAVQYGRVPPFFLLVGLAKPLYAAGLFMHRKLGGPILDLPHSYMRRRLAGFQMGVAAVILYPPVVPQLALLAESLVGIPFLVGFLRDFLVVSGRINPADPYYTKWKGRLGRFLFTRLPPLLRLAALALVVERIAVAIMIAGRGLYALSPWRSTIQSMLYSAQGPVNWFFLLSQVLALGCLAIAKATVAIYAASGVFLVTELLRTTQGRVDVNSVAATAVVFLLLILQPDRKQL